MSCHRKTRLNVGLLYRACIKVMIMEIRKYKGTASHFMAACILAVMGGFFIIAAMLLPPLGYIDPTVLTAFGELLTFSGALAGMDYRYVKSEGGNKKTE